MRERRTTIDEVVFTEFSRERLMPFLTPFYTNRTIQSIFHHSNRALWHPDLHAENGPTYTNPFYTISYPEAERSYWNLHSRPYVRRLRTLLSQQPEKLDRIRNCETMLIIPTRSEPATSGSIEAHARSYGRGFLSDTGIIIYHNFTEQPPDDTLKDLEHCEHWYNAVVIHDQVPETQTLPMTAKIAYDLACLASEKPWTTFVRTDADVLNIGAHAIVKARELLRNTNAFAVSSLYTHDSVQLRKRFPIYAFISRLDTELKRQHAILGNYSFYKGFFGVLPKHIYASIGGQKVLSDWGGLYRPATYDDVMFNNDFQALMRAHFHATDQRNVGDLTNQGVIIELNTAREINAILSGKKPDIRWEIPQIADREYKQPKIRVESIHGPHDAILLDNYSESAVLEALDQYLFPKHFGRHYLPSYKSVPVIQALIAIGCTSECIGSDRFASQCTVQITPETRIAGTILEDFSLDSIVSITIPSEYTINR